MNREIETELIEEGDETMIWYSLVHDGRECRGFMRAPEDMKEQDAEAFVIESTPWEKPQLSDMSPFTQWLLCRCEDSEQLMNFYEAEDMEDDLNRGIITLQDIRGFENDLDRLEATETDYEITHDGHGYHVESNDAAVTVYMAQLCQFNYDRTMQQAEERMRRDHHPMRRTGRRR